MYKKILALMTFCLVIILSSLFIINSASADGMMISKSYIYGQWDYSSEDSQQAYINYENGVQKMILSVGYQENENGQVWLFPVPSKPENVKIDILDNIPIIKGGIETTELAHNNIREISSSLASTQIYPIFVESFFRSRFMYASTGQTTGLSLSKEIDGTSLGVTVYSHLEKSGITSEIITAKTADGLFLYLKNRGINVVAGSIPVLNKYIGKDYSFVVSWLQNTGTQKKSNSKGLFVSFKTNDIYFPLMPTSVYGNKEVPATIRIVGHVTPRIYNDINIYSKVTFFSQGHITKEDSGFFKGNIDNIKYTNIYIKAPSRLLTEDLWIKDKVPSKLFLANTINANPIVLTIILLIIVSIISSLLVGYIFLKELRQKKIKYLLLGLANCFTIFGLLIATLLTRTKEHKGEAFGVLLSLKDKGYIFRRRLAMASFIIFIPSLFVAYEVYDYMFSGYYYENFHGNNISSIVSMFFLFLPIVSLLLGLVCRRIKSEDKPLLKQLHQIKYSTWTFVPKDKKKIGYLILFSTLFLILIISLLIVISINISESFVII